MKIKRAAFCTFYGNGLSISAVDDMGNRLADSVETALNLANGLLIVENADDGEQTLFSEHFACPVSGFTIPEIEPRLFSFNNPHGACPTCDGLGMKMNMVDHLRAGEVGVGRIMGLLADS